MSAGRRSAAGAQADEFAKAKDTLQLRKERLTHERRNRVVGSRALPRVITAGRNETAEAVRNRLIWNELDCIDYVHAIDPTGRLVGVAPLSALMSAAGEGRIESLIQGEALSVQAGMHPERALAFARRHHLSSVPVVDQDGRLVGTVTAQALLDIARREHSEDISRFAGLVHETARARVALDESPWRRVRHRLPWLLIGVVGSMVATMVMAEFEEKLAAHIAVAFFVPAIVYLADAIGTQTEAIVVRGLSLRHLQLGGLLAGEVFTGSIVGATLGLLIAGFAYAVFADLQLAVAVGIAVALSGSTAAACGVLFPWLLSYAGTDPAFGSGPVATVIQDVITIFVYLSVVASMLA